MMQFIWFCAAGHSFFIGIPLLIIATAFSFLCKQTWHKLLIYAAVIIASFLVILSAAPFPLWFFIIWAIPLLFWFIFFVLRNRRKVPLTTSAILFCVLTTAAFATQLPYYQYPQLPKQQFEKLYIIGDSVTAGIGGQQEQTWPKIIRDKYGIDVVDLSCSGATVATAVKQAAQVNNPNAIVLLEIGGNDLFGPTPYSEFEKNLNQILEMVSGSHRLIVMLELPLLPWQIEYGRIQRKLAKQYNVIFVPKRFFVSVLSAKNSTTDLAHLSPAGHRLMAEKIWSLLSPILKNSLDKPAILPVKSYSWSLPLLHGNLTDFRFIS